MHQIFSLPIHDLLKLIFQSYHKLLDGNPDGFRELRLRGDSFAHSRDFYFFLKSRLGIQPVITNADDLLANPENMMEAYCKRVGLTYKQGMTK